MRVLLLVAISLELIATAAEAKPAFRATVAQGWAVAFPNGEGKALPPTTVVGLGLSTPVEKAWGLYNEVALVVPSAVFNPAPRLIAGVSLKLENMVVVATVFYQYNPTYSNIASHQIAMAANVGVVVSKEITIIGTLGLGKVIDGPWSIGLSPKIAFLLPF